MRFSVVTPSYRQFAWLQRCVRSVADQRVECEHLIQDGGTGAELEEWVRRETKADLQVAPDRGMYDALNHGFARATGELFCFLNCDEQYLPGTLAKVEHAFATQPELEMVVGDSLVIAPDGELLCFRRSTPLRRAMVLTDHLYAYTCTIFFRRTLWERTGPFSLEYRAASDADWVGRALLQRPCIGYLRDYLSTFVITGENLSKTAGGAAEGTLLQAELPRWQQRAAPVLRAFRHVEKLARGGYHSGPIEYAIYPEAQSTERRLFRSERPSSRHPWA